jgi:site-specific DNA-methyltransferase (adenine-specific)
MELNRNTEVESLQVSPPDAKPMLPAVPSVVYNEDCVEGLKRFSDNHFDLAIVDPPYGIDDKLYRSSHGKNKNSAIAKHYKKENRWDIQPTAEYWEQLFRVSKNQIVWGGNYFTKNLPESRGWICWDKVRPTGNSFSDFELAWMSFDTMPKMFRFCANGGFIATPQNRYKIHPTQKVVELYDFIFTNYAKEGDLILDTHLGSGSSRISSHKAGLSFVGFEIDKDYYEAQEKRFKDFVSQLRLF